MIQRKQCDFGNKINDDDNDNDDDVIVHDDITAADCVIDYIMPSVTQSLVMPSLRPKN